jgi:hypothetical protein
MPYKADVTGSNPLSFFPYVNMSKKKKKRKKKKKKERKTEGRKKKKIQCKDSKLNTKLQTFNLDSSI